MIAKRIGRIAAAGTAAAMLLVVPALGAGQALAAPPAGTGANGGHLTFDPPTGTNATFPYFTTSGGCPSTPDGGYPGNGGYQVTVSGPGLFATGKHLVIGNSQFNFSTSGAFTTDAASAGILDLQHDLGGTSSVNLAGEYDFTLNCINSVSQAVEATFTGALYFSTPTTYSTTPPAAPVVKTAATATGVYKVGYTLVCGATFTGTGPISYKYAWLNNGVTIASATTNKLVLSGAYYNRTVSCKVTATNSVGSTPSTSLGQKIAIGNKPGLKTLPVITGTAKVGYTLKSSAGTWTYTGLTTHFQWRRNGVAISGTAAKKYYYKLTTADRGRYMTCTVTVTKLGYAGAYATSKPTKKVV
jgi:hypothetical protein